MNNNDCIRYFASNLILKTYININFFVFVFTHELEIIVVIKMVLSAQPSSRIQDEGLCFHSGKSKMVSHHISFSEILIHLLLLSPNNIIFHLNVVPRAKAVPRTTVNVSWEISWNALPLNLLFLNR